MLGSPVDFASLLGVRLPGGAHAFRVRLLVVGFASWLGCSSPPLGAHIRARLLVNFRLVASDSTGGFQAPDWHFLPAKGGDPRPSMAPFFPQSPRLFPLIGAKPTSRIQCPFALLLKDK